MWKIVFIDKNEQLVKKVQALFDKLWNWNWMEFYTHCRDVFEFKKKNPDYKLCTASNPNFTMWWWLDAQIKKHYPNECNNLKEFVWTDNLFPIITVDKDIKSSGSIIKRALAGIFAYRHKFNFILTGIGTSIGWLDESILLKEFANLRSANLRSADLRSSDLCSADLSSTKIKNVITNEFTANFMLNCPEEWDFIWRKKGSDWEIIKLLIPAKSKRSSATSRKCRAEYVKTLEITKDWKKIKECLSKYDKKTKYVVWKITKCNKREEDRWIECWHWIHFFITKNEAEQRNN